jgi:hypothetical protein
MVAGLPNVRIGSRRWRTPAREVGIVMAVAVLTSAVGVLLVDVDGYTMALVVT